MHSNGTMPQEAASAVQAPATIMAAPASAVQAAARPKRQLGGYRADAGIAQRLAAAQIAVNAVLADPGLQAALAAYGYDVARMREGHSLCERAQTLVQQQQARLGDQLAATDARDGAQATAREVYRNHVGVARVALRGERGAAQALDLTARKRSKSGWLVQAQQFYANVLADTALLGKLSRFGLSEPQLVAGQRLVAAVASGAVAQQRGKGVAQEALRTRDAALDELNTWMRDFLAIARIALARHPQTLERLGVVVAS